MALWQYLPPDWQSHGLLTDGQEGELMMSDELMITDLWFLLEANLDWS